MKTKYSVNALVIPDLLSTIVGTVFSNIPAVKKGTDSRLGWGFRLGDRAEFQVLVELGPQTYTRPLTSEETGNIKRTSIHRFSNVLQREKGQFSNKNSEKPLSENKG